MIVQKKQAKSLRNSKNKKKYDINLSIIRSYPKQNVWDTWLPLFPSKGTTTVTTGVIASSYQIYITAINNFAARFGSTFVEYRIVQANISLRFFSSINPGAIQCWCDEKSTSAPTVTEGRERYTWSYNASDIENTKVMKWKCVDLLDLQYSPIGTTYTPVSFKAYTNNADFGSSITATDYFEILGTARVQFRGLQ